MPGRARPSVRTSKDFYAGLLFIAFGSLAIVVARHYPMGSSLRMGPGYFPMVLGGLLVLLGVVTGLRALWIREAVPPVALRPLVLVLGAVLAFALVVQGLGLVLATVALVVVSCLGGSGFRTREVIAICFVLTALVVGLFVYGLGLPFRVWPIG